MYTIHTNRTVQLGPPEPVKHSTAGTARTSKAQYSWDQQSQYIQLPSNSVQSGTGLNPVIPVTQRTAETNRTSKNNYTEFSLELTIPVKPVTSSTDGASNTTQGIPGPSETCYTSTAGTSFISRTYYAEYRDARKSSNTKYCHQTTSPASITTGL